MSKQELIEKMLSDKAKSNNTICLNAYAIGLDEMYEQLRQYNVVGRSEQLCGNLDKNYSCKNMCLTRCVDGNKFYK